MPKEIPKPEQQGKQEKAQEEKEPVFATEEEIAEKENLASGARSTLYTKKVANRHPIF